MNRAILALGALVFAASTGCGNSDKAGGVSSAVSAPAPSASAVEKKDPGVSGTYRAAWGDTVFTQVGNNVNATYPGGSFTCTAAGDVLDCTWKEGTGAGKALLQRQADGSIKGNWGNGPSPTDGGQWTFSPKK
ncbi:MAG: hypothetical protein ABI193_02945 [Minicystis sp.]